MDAQTNARWNPDSSAQQMNLESALRYAGKVLLTATTINVMMETIRMAMDVTRLANLKRASVMSVELQEHTISAMRFVEMVLIWVWSCAMMEIIFLVMAAALLAKLNKGTLVLVATQLVLIYAKRYVEMA